MTVDINTKKEYIVLMKYTVATKKSVIKRFDRLPEKVQDRFFTLVQLLKSDGPTAGRAFQNYSKLSGNEYHCHLTYHYVACWRHEKETIIIEVYYVGSREDAPY